MSLINKAFWGGGGVSFVLLYSQYISPSCVLVLVHLIMNIGMSPLV